MPAPPLHRDAHDKIALPHTSIVMSSEADLAALTALSPLDGRYAAKVAALSPHFSEYGLVRHRIRVELAWLVALSDEAGIAELAPFSMASRKAIEKIAV